MLSVRAETLVTHQSHCKRVVDVCCLGSKDFVNNSTFLFHGRNHSNHKFFPCSKLCFNVLVLRDSLIALWQQFKTFKERNMRSFFAIFKVLFLQWQILGRMM
ncbi:hypothetical protein ILYODFUR_012015 [Ilyodon furcidens]|uniref:Uncharacterized protein n=1 Tax=Ilyodon furcidens TaxID=33524 RepID=A0ABV0U4Q4_9TELE